VWFFYEERTFRSARLDAFNLSSVALRSFELIGPINGIEVIASGRGIRELAELQKRFGRCNWRKLKGSLPSEVRMVRLFTSSFIGMKLTVSGSGG
jgi:hypothetical protein